MNDSIRTLEARIRQLRAADRNALDVYTTLVELCSDQTMREKLSAIAKDEERHILLEEEMLELLRK